MDKKSVSEEHLMCPICMEVPRGNIFQCKNGHHICEDCSAPLKQCPTCRVGLGHPKTRIRNRAMETLLDSMQFECVHKDQGCQLKIGRRLLTEHENNCEHKPFRLCSLIGYDKCDFIVPKISQLAIGHLQLCHQIPVSHGSDLSIVLENLLTKRNIEMAEQTSVKWEPLLWKLENDNYGPVFLLLFRMSHQQESVVCSWTCLHIGQSETEAAKFKMNFSIPNVLGNDKDFELKWTDTPSPFRQAREVLKEISNSIPLVFLQHIKKAQPYSESQHYALKMKVKVTDQPGNEAKNENQKTGDDIHLVQILHL